MARGGNNNPTGKGGAKKGEVRNPSGTSTSIQVGAKDFKEWAFAMWQKHKDSLENVVISDPKMAMDFMRMCAGFVPKDINLGGEVKHQWMIIRHSDKGDK